MDGLGETRDRHDHGRPYTHLTPSLCIPYYRAMRRHKSVTAPGRVNAGGVSTLPTAAKEKSGDA